MITKDEFSKIDKEIEDSIYQTLQKIKAISLSNYILILASGEYQEILLMN